MKKKLNSITVRIWAAFAFTILIFGIFLISYYPERQRELIYESQQREFMELARTVSLGIEISLQSNNFSGLQKSVDYVVQNKQLDAVVVTAEDAFEPVTSYLQDVTIQDVLSEGPDMLVVRHPYFSDSFNGEVLIAVRNERIEAKVDEINRPVYILFTSSILITIVLFFFLARQISRSVRGAILIAKRIEAKEYDIDIRIEGAEELRVLKKSLAELRDTLLNQDRENEELTINLEEKVATRTVELEVSQKEITEINKTLEDRVQKRTTELQDTLDRMQLMHNELVNKERLASLGQLIAGIAHEINSPLGAIISSIDNLKDGVDKIFTEETFKVSLELMERAIELANKNALESAFLTSKEERTNRDKLNEIFQSKYGFDGDSRYVAQSLAEQGVADVDVEFLDQLFKEKELEAAINVSLLILSSKSSLTTTDLASKQVASVVQALKNQVYSSRDTSLSEISLYSNIADVLLLFRSQTKNLVDVTLNIPKDLTILCNPSAIAQVWVNLVSNALQAMDYKGVLTIDGEINGKEVTVHVSNDGPPIPQEIQETIFEPFYTTKKIGDGTGMGLSIISDIIFEHKGTVIVESNEELTTFSVTFPLAESVSA